jgi:hypothetical protein
MELRGGKRVAAIVVVAAVLVIGLSGTAIAYVFDNGSNSGTGSVGTGAANGFSVSSPSLQGGPLSIDPNNFDTISSSISNFTGLPLTLNQIQVQITGITVDAAIQNPAWPACTASQFVLAAISAPGWGGPQMTSNNGVLEGPAAVWTSNLPLTVPNGRYVTGGQTLSPSAVNGVPPGLVLEWLDQGSGTVQNNCLGATVNVTVSTNGPPSSGGSPANAPTFTVTKSAAPAAVYAGSSTPISYTLTAQNTGSGSGSLNIGDTVPSGTTLVSGSNGCPAVTPPTTCSSSVAGDIVRWTIADLPAGGSVAVTFEVTADSGDAPGTISNTGYWSGPGCTSGPGCPTNTTSTNVATPPIVTPSTSLLITASSTTSMYGSGPPTVTWTSTPSVAGPLQTPPTCTSTITATAAVGTYTAANTCSGASDPGFTVTYAPGTAMVDATPLTVTASSGSFTQGGTPPAISAAYSGFQNGEGASSLKTPPACSTTATSSSTSGTYPSTCSGAVDANYTITYVSGTVAVTAPGSLVATTPSATTPVSTPSGGTSPPVASPATNAQIAFTGALLSEEWLVGMAALLLGSGLVVLARRRRRTPGHAAK